MTPYNDEALSQALTRFVQAQVPLSVVHSSNNRFWSAAGAYKTVTTLREAAQAPGVNVSPKIYQLLNVAGYGHLDCIVGKTVAEVVLPFFSTFFE